MKRFFITILMSFCVFPAVVQAQFFDGYSIAVIGNRTNIISHEFDDFRNYKNGIGIGLHAQKAISKNISLLSGIEFSALRYELEINQVATGPGGMPKGETFGDKATSNLYILSVPILMKLEGPAKFFGFIGPRMDFKLGSRNGVLEFKVGGMQFNQEDRLSENSEFFVAGWSAGLGKKITVGSFTPSISFRYSGDLTNLIRNEGFIALKKRRFEILLGIPLSW